MSFWKPKYSKIGGLGDPNARYSKGADHMIKRVFEENDGKSPMYYCTLCSRPYGALHEAIEHAKFCGQAVPIQPAFRSYTTAATFNEDDDTQTYQRPWVGLTIEEVQDSWNADYQKQTRAIEAKLKKKNT